MTGETAPTAPGAGDHERTDQAGGTRHPALLLLILVVALVDIGLDPRPHPGRPLRGGLIGGILIAWRSSSPSVIPSPSGGTQVVPGRAGGAAGRRYNGTVAAPASAGSTRSPSRRKVSTGSATTNPGGQGQRAPTATPSRSPLWSSGRRRTAQALLRSTTSPASRHPDRNRGPARGQHPPYDAHEDASISLRVNASEIHTQLTAEDR